MDPLERFAAGFQALLRRRPTSEELSAFSRYLSLLLKWNRVTSLTAYRDPDAILEKLFLDSLLFLRFLPPKARILDLGSGAGIPGIPVKIVQPQSDLTLIEARRRRTSFLSAVVRELALEGVRVLTGRGEVLITEVPGLEGGFDAVLTRSAGPVETILPLALRFVGPKGRVIASGRPARKKPQPQEVTVSWETVTSPISGSHRRFLVVEKT